VHETVGEHGPAVVPERVLDPERARELEQVEAAGPAAAAARVPGEPVELA